MDQHERTYLSAILFDGLLVIAVCILPQADCMCRKSTSLDLVSITVKILAKVDVTSNRRHTYIS